VGDFHGNLFNWPGFAANWKCGTKCDLILNVLQLNYLIQNLAGATGTGAGTRRMNEIISLESGLIFNYKKGHFGRMRQLAHKSSISWDSYES
jgi:hypothetical protein